MNIYDWMHSATDQEREALATDAETSVAYLWQLAWGHRNPSRKLAERLESKTSEITPTRVIDKVSALFGKSAA